MKSSKKLNTMKLPLALCLISIVVEKMGFDIFHHSAIYYFFVYLSFIGYVSAFTLGAYRSPVLSLPIAIAATFLIPHEDCGMSIGVLPGLSIMPSWIIGLLYHFAGCMFKFNKGKVSIDCDNEKREVGKDEHS